MTQRRQLIEGIKSSLPEVDPRAAAEFITGTAQPVISEPVRTVQASVEEESVRVPITSRVRQDVANALKRASLERQLQRQRPWAVQDILEEALEPWLRDRGYLP